MEKLDVLNIVSDELCRARRNIDFQIKKIRRDLSLVTDRQKFLETKLLHINYEECAFGHFYIARDFNVGDIMEAMVHYYLNNKIFVEMTPEEKEKNIKTDSYNFFVSLELEQSLKSLVAPQPKQANDGQTADARHRPTRGRGRPKETLKDKLIDDADGRKLQKIHTLMKGKKGKDAALIILVCIKKGWMAKPTYTQVKNEFGDIGAQQGFTKYLNSAMISNEEIEGVMGSLE